ncbi:MAG: alpha/beta hydrolase [Luteimonas sp.]|nr:alpha/beta hydrolase [Luteimonas sp.]
MQALLLVGVALIPFAVFGQGSAPDKKALGDCHAGSYRLSDGTEVDIGNADDGKLRWRRKDGTTGLLAHSPEGSWRSTLGWTDRADGVGVAFADCSKGTLTFAGLEGRKLEFDVTETRFKGAGVTLAGRLTLPPGRGRVPIVVLIHGSENFSALDYYSLQRQFASEGIGVFAYDKRGTGASEGRYSQDYLVLATDAIAATREAKRLAGPRAGRVGYQGGSQGGWVAPLAARIELVDFVIVGFGLAVSPLDEDREAIAFDMERQGYGAEEKAKAMEVADATATIVLSNFREGYEQLEAVKKKYAAEPWFKHVHGNFSFYLLETPEAVVRDQGPLLLAGVPAQYDPMPVLQNLDVPQLWILGEQDTDAPFAETRRRLSHLKSKGRPITVATYPGADHGIYEFELDKDGKRVSTRNPDGYFRMMRDFIIDGRLKSRYGTARFVD